MTQDNNFCFPSQICDLGRDWQERLISALSIIRWATLIKNEWSISKVTHSHTAGKLVLAVKSTLIPLPVGVLRARGIGSSSRGFAQVVCASLQHGSWVPRGIIPREHQAEAVPPFVTSLTELYIIFIMPFHALSAKEATGPGSTWRSDKVLGKPGNVAAILGKLHCAISSHIRRQGHCHSFGWFFKPKIKISS